MKKYLPIAASVLLLAACSEKPGYEITGTVSNSDLNGKYVYLYEYGVKDAAPLDSALVQNGSFALKGTQNAPALRTLRFSEEVVEPVRVAPGENAPFMATFVLENGKLAVVLDSTSTVSGTPENDAQKELQAKIKDLRSGIDKLVADMKSGDENLIKQAEAKVAIGQKFTDFEMPNAKGEVHKLSEYVGNGKVVLIDFWASWCPPCRAEMPNLVKAYKDYKDKGFDIVGISLDSKADAWAKGVKDLNITWTQLSDLKGWQNSGAALYGVNSIPHTVLVDKDGTIIAKNLHGQELEDKIKEVLK